VPVFERWTPTLASRGARVKISGGADIIGQAIKAGVVDDVTLHLAPILLGKGVRLFENLAAEDLTLEPMGTTGSPWVTHLAYRVVR
jgi:dihydrofolate reductase